MLFEVRTRVSNLYTRRAIGGVEKECEKPFPKSKIGCGWLKVSRPKKIAATLSFVHRESTPNSDGLTGQLHT